MGKAVLVLILQSEGETVFMAVNMALQGILSLPVQQVAAAQQLGAFIKTYQASWWRECSFVQGASLW
jgi:hypothetical protein